MVLVLINVRTGRYLGPWADVMVDLGLEPALYDNFLIMGTSTQQRRGALGPAPNYGGRGGAVPIRGGQ